MYSIMAAKGSSQELRKSIEIVNKTAYMVGLNLMNPKRELNARLTGSMLFICFVYTCCFYSFWILRSHWKEALEVAGILILAIQGCNKYWIGIVHKARYAKLFVKSEQIYSHFHADKKNRHILKKNTNMLAKILKFMVCVYLSAEVLIILLGVSLSMTTREKTLLLTLFVPNVSPQTSFGYIATNLNHILLMSFAANGFLASDTAFVAIVIPIVGYADSFRNEINNFNRLVDAPKRDQKQISEKLAHICMLHQMIVGYENDIIHHFNTGNLVQVSSQACCIILFIFLAYICQYMQAYCMLFPIFFELTQYCILGTIVTVKNDQITRDIYDINWHMLKKSEQRIVFFMLHRAQNAMDISVGGVASLNMMTYVQILKTAYTFLTMLVTVLE